MTPQILSLQSVQMWYHPLISPVALQMDFHLVGHVRVFFYPFLLHAKWTQTKKESAWRWVWAAELRSVAALALTSGGLDPSPKYRGIEQNT